MSDDRADKPPPATGMSRFFRGLGRPGRDPDEAARDADELLSMAEEAGGIGIWDTDLATGLSRGTPQFYRILGLEPRSEPVPIETFRALRHPEDRARVTEGYQRSLARGEEFYEAEYRIIRPDGEMRWIFGRGRTLRDEGGRPVRYSGVDLDITERKRAEAALRISEERLRVAQEAGGIAVFERDFTTERSVWSPALYRLYGLEPQPDGAGVSLDTFLARLHPDDRERHLAERAAALASDRPDFAFEFRIIRPDGEVRWIASRGQQYRGPDGRVMRALGVNFDITALKQAEEELRASEARFSTAFHAAAHPMSISTLADGRYIDVNAASLAASGKSREQVIGHTARELGFYVDPDQFDRVRALLRDSGRFTDLETELKGSTGARTFLLSGAQVALGGEQVLLTSAIDITERKRAEAELRVSEARLEQAARVAGLGIFDYDHVGRTTHWSPGMHALWGWPGDPPPDLRAYLRQVEPDDRERLLAAVAGSREPASDGVFEAEHRLRQPDGSVRWVAVRGRTLFAGTGAARRATRSIGAMRDVTESKQAEDHIRLLMREVNHRANNLLAVVVAVARQMADSAAAREYAERLAQRLVALSASHKLLLTGPLEGTELAALVRSQLAHFHELVGGRVRLDGPLLRLAPQAVQAVGMALHELATNAGKYGALSGSAGQVQIDWDLVRNGAGQELRLAWRESGGPPVMPPVRTGFGHTVMVRMMERAVGGTVRLDFAPDGLRWTLVCPADQALEAGH